jgi:predicted peroxiredoxin
MSSAVGESAAREPFWVLLLQRDAPDVLYEAAAMAAAAVSLGVGVTLVWFDAALEALVSGRLEEGDGEELPGAWRLLSETRQTGRLRMLACSASMVSRKLSPEELRSKVDDIVGWPTAVSLIRRAERSFVW